MGFDIRFIKRHLTKEGLVVEAPRPAAMGRIAIADFREDFYSPLDVWQCSDYEAQWEDALQRLRNGLTSCFVVCVHPLSIAQFIECWICWRQTREYRIQNQCLFMDEVGILDPRHPYGAIGPYRAVTDDGERIDDDWGLPLDAVR
jgi:hypothetical protein